MSEVIKELYLALEQLRDTLQDVKISDKVKDQLEELLTPLFANPVSCQRITEIINEVGDFTENVLVPLLEQYVSSNVALRVRFLIEDLLVFVENYRDEILKKLAQKSKETQQERLQGQVDTEPVRDHTKLTQLAPNSATNAYRADLSGAPVDARGKMKLKARQESIARLGSKQSAINASFHVVDKVKEQREFKVGGNGGSEEKMPPVAAILVDKKKQTLKEVSDLEIPKLVKSGQVLIKVISVGLNHWDRSGIAGARKSLFRKTAMMSEPPQITQIKALGDTLVNLATNMGGSKSEAVRQNALSLRNVVPKKPQVLGIEFYGQIKDIAWQRGDFLHKMNVAREDFVYGILREAEDNSSGVLGEYVVCEVSDVVRCPRRIDSFPSVAASLAVDGSTVCRALAATDIINPRGTNILVVGGNLNSGLILLELLIKDLKIPTRNLFTLVPGNAKSVLSRGGLLDGNIKVYGDEESFAESCFDVIFDCVSETDYAESKSKVDYSKLLERKMKRTCQFLALDSNKILVEKKASGDDWQKELNLLNKLVEKRSLTMRMFMTEQMERENLVDFNAEAVMKNLELLRHPDDFFGKLVVEITPQNVSSFKARAVVPE